MNLSSQVKLAVCVCVRARASSVKACATGRSQIEVHLPRQLSATSPHAQLDGSMHEVGKGGRLSITCVLVKGLAAFLQALPERHCLRLSIVPDTG